MDPTEARTTSVYRASLVALLGLIGCGVAIVLTTPPAPTTTLEVVGALAGLFLAFVGVAGVADAFWGR